MLQEYLGFCVAVPAFVALVGTLLAGRLPARVQGASAAGIVLVALLLSGFMLLGKHIHNPERHWHWLPAIAVLATVVGLGTFRAGSQWWLRILGAGLVGGVGGWLLVPTWKDLADSRWLLIACLGLAIAGLILLCDWLSRWARPLFALFCFGVAAIVGAAWIGAGFSLTNARWLLILAATLGGVILAGMLPVRFPRVEVRMLLPLLCCWLLGGLFIGAIEPKPPRHEILLLGLLPPALLAAGWWLRDLFQQRVTKVPSGKM